MKPEAEYSLYLVTDRDCLKGKDLVESVEQAILGGVTIVQLREKSLSTREFLALAYQMKEITSRYHVPLLINDRLDIALAVEADGLHVGQDDLPLPLARKLLGPDKIIGVSASTLEEALLAQEQGADYLGVGAMFATPTKTDAKLVSLSELARIREKVRLPIVAIGGIKETNVREVMKTGVDGISVVSAILAQEDCRRAAARLRELMFSPQA